MKEIITEMKRDLYDAPVLSEKERNRKIKKEVIVSLGLYFVFFCWWYITGYGLVLAMTLVATFTSAISFVGGPGIAYSKGLVWVYLSMIQVPTAFIILGVLGKKFAVISRKANAVTVTDHLRTRYKSPVVVIGASVALVLFFMAQMMSQFLGGAILFQLVTGLSYIYGLILFGIVAIVSFMIASFIGRPSDKETLDLFFG